MKQDYKKAVVYELKILQQNHCSLFASYYTNKNGGIMVYLGYQPPPVIGDEVCTRTTRTYTIYTDDFRSNTTIVFDRLTGREKDILFGYIDSIAKKIEISTLKLCQVLSDQSVLVYELK